VRAWADDIYSIAVGEMLHLAQAWNLLGAVGGTPYYLRPNFPQGSKYYPMEAELKLEPFGHRALQRFLLYERPRTVDLEADYAAPVSTIEPWTRYRSVGGLYALIQRGFDSLPPEQLFVGDATHQVGPELVYLRDLIRVVDRDTARAAIEMITEQGEGCSTGWANSHHGLFTAISDGYEREVQASRRRRQAFRPARPAVTNPAPRIRGDYGASKVTLLVDSYAKQVSELFDETYGLMLRMLQYVFTNPASDPRIIGWFARTSIGLMPMVIKPLGEALTMLPSGLKSGSTAGPSFGMTRHVPLSPEPQAASILAWERLVELVAMAREAADNSRAPAQIGWAADNIAKLLPRRSRDRAG
jgi:Ferritin-like